MILLSTTTPEITTVQRWHARHKEEFGDQNDLSKVRKTEIVKRSSNAGHPDNWWETWLPIALIHANYHREAPSA